MSMTFDEAFDAYCKRFPDGEIRFRFDLSDESHVDLIEMALERGTPLTMEDYDARESDIPPGALS